jgi:hypothetical protein
MKDYMGLYNERFTKQAPRFNNAYQARTYQDYIRNIQNQRAAAGQTFGGLNAQMQNQSFYDRAMGTPPGLSGGMQQQFSNQLSGARARQLGQTAQQRYQAFADLSNQELQASQFARAEAASEQQFQTQNIAFKQQQQAQAQAIMKSNASDGVKQAQLAEIGLSRDEIADLQPKAGPAVIGGAMTLGTAVPTALAASNYLNYQTNIIRGAQMYGTEASKLFVKGADGIYALQSGQGIAAPTKGIVKTQFDKVNVAIQKYNEGKALTGAQKLNNRQLGNLKRKVTNAYKDLVKSQGDLVKEVVDGSMQQKGFLKGTAAKLKSKITGKISGVSKATTKGGVKLVTKASGTKLAELKAAATTKITAGAAKTATGAKAAFFKGAAGFMGSALGIGIAIFLVAEVGSQILTGTGVIKGAMNLLSGKDYNEGTKGLVT